MTISKKKIDSMSLSEALKEEIVKGSVECDQDCFMLTSEALITIFNRVGKSEWDGKVETINQRKIIEHPEVELDPPKLIMKEEYTFEGFKPVCLPHDERLVRGNGRQKLIDNGKRSRPAAKQRRGHR